MWAHLLDTRRVMGGGIRWPWSLTKIPGGRASSDLMDLHVRRVLHPHLLRALALRRRNLGSGRRDPVPSHPPAALPSASLRLSRVEGLASNQGHGSLRPVRLAQCSPTSPFVRPSDSHCRGNSGCSGLAQSHRCLAETPLTRPNSRSSSDPSSFRGLVTCDAVCPCPSGVSSFLTGRGKGLGYPSPWASGSGSPCPSPVFSPVFDFLRNFFQLKI